MAESKQGINPCSFRSKHKDQLTLTIARMHVQIESELRKILTVAMFDEQTKEPKAITVLDEDDFLNGIGHLFSRGELANVHLAVPVAPVDDRVGPRS